MKFQDANKNTIELKSSSLATQEACRITVNDAEGREAVRWVSGKGWEPAPVPQVIHENIGTKYAFTEGVQALGLHLNQRQARRLALALLEFSFTGKVP